MSEAVLILTVSGSDRAGLVERLAELVAARGGNWEDSRMAHLAERFAGILKVRLPESERAGLESDLNNFHELSVTVMEGREVPDSQGSRNLQLKIVGSDHPGIVRDIFSVLAEAGVNVEQLSTQVAPAPESGGTIFEADARLACAPEVDPASIRANVEHIAADIMVDVEMTA